jgi:hypothetical protein
VVRLGRGGPALLLVQPRQRALQVAQAVDVGDVQQFVGQRALFTQPRPLSHFGALDVPVLLMVGRDPPASSRGVARRLSTVLPRLQLLEFEGLSQMGPITPKRSMRRSKTLCCAN